LPGNLALSRLDIAVDFVEYVSKVHPMDQNLIAGFLFDAAG
jgi:hypothetical protein